MDKIQIIGVPQSNYVWVVRMACEEKGVPYEIVPMRPHTPDIDALHPLGKIPGMRHGDVALCESKAPAQYYGANATRLLNGPGPSDGRPAGAIEWMRCKTPAGWLNAEPIPTYVICRSPSMHHQFKAHPGHPAVDYLMVRLHADLGGQIQANKDYAVKLATDMRAVEAVIKLFNPEFNCRAISARRKQNTNPWFKSHGLRGRAGDAKGFPEQSAQRLKKHGLKETEASITNKLARGTFPATFFLACVAALELDGVALEEI